MKGFFIHAQSKYTINELMYQWGRAKLDNTEHKGSRSLTGRGGFVDGWLTATSQEHECSATSVPKKLHV